MAQLVPITLEDGTTLYIEATEDVDVSPTATSTDHEDLEAEEGTTRSAKGWSQSGQRNAAAMAAQSFKAIEGTIRTYTSHTLNAFKDMSDANIDKVTLQFGIRVGGEAGIPYVTKGAAESNLSITVECSFDRGE
ncbi:MAG: hypothetical protein HC800_00735 [Phormidesmis sp. RL_2_1]|nr:hypothetical protein [Phormidesmis sp. RL_2_1]